MSGTTTGKLVLWDCKSSGHAGGMNKKESYLPKVDLSRQVTKVAANREVTRATSKSSGSTRSGTLSSRKSSGKTVENGEENNPEKPTPVDEQPPAPSQIEQDNNGKYRLFSPCENLLPHLDQMTNDRIGLSSAMNKQALKLCEPQRKAITVLTTTNE